MPTNDATRAALLDAATRLGEEAGRAAASWYFDGNSDHATYVRVWRGLETGDPEVMDTLPSSPLSGEWADDPTPGDVLRTLGVDEFDYDNDDLLDAYAEGFEAASYRAIEDEARAQVFNPYALNDDRHSPIAYTYDADYHCPACAARRFGVDESREVFTDAADSENNPIGAVFAWDEWHEPSEPGRQVLACGTCGGFIAEVGEDLTARDAAREAARWFETKTREDGTSFVALRDGRPEWLVDLVRAAHGPMLPDDRIHDLAHACVLFVRDEDDYDDRADEWADGCCDTYSADLFEWAGSHAARLGFVEEAREEWGEEGATVLEWFQRGQYLEAREVFGSVVSSLEDAAEAGLEDASPAEAEPL